MKKILLLAMIVGFIGIAQLVYATKIEIELTAIDSESFQLGATYESGYGDNMLRAYEGPDYFNYQRYDGFIKFDLSSLPDKSNIKSMTLTTYFLGPSANSYDDPIVRIYRSANDSWSRGHTMNSAYPGINEVLTGFHSGFPSGYLAPYDWSLDVKAVNWSADLTDNILSLAMHIENPAEYCYVYFYGSDKNPAPPTLTIEFTAPEHAVPEPATMLLLASGLIGLAGYGRKKFFKK